MLETPSIWWYSLGEIPSSDNPTSADNQQERPANANPCIYRNPQRLYAEHHRKMVKIESDLHGDMQSQGRNDLAPDVHMARRR